MIDIKEATRIAFEYVQKIYGGELPALMLEEVELSDDGYWLITVGFNRPSAPRGPFDQVVSPMRYDRVYKVIKIDASSGEAKSMKIRQL